MIFDFFKTSGFQPTSDVLYSNTHFEPGCYYYFLISGFMFSFRGINDFEIKSYMKLIIVYLISLCLTPYMSSSPLTTSTNDDEMKANNVFSTTELYTLSCFIVYSSYSSVVRILSGINNKMDMLLLLVSLLFICLFESKSRSLINSLLGTSIGIFFRKLISEDTYFPPPFPSSNYVYACYSICYCLVWMLCNYLFFETEENSAYSSTLLVTSNFVVLTPLNLLSLGICIGGGYDLLSNYHYHHTHQENKKKQQLILDNPLLQYIIGLQHELYCLQKPIQSLCTIYHISTAFNLPILFIISIIIDLLICKPMIYIIHQLISLWGPCIYYYIKNNSQYYYQIFYINLLQNQYHTKIAIITIYYTAMVGFLSGYTFLVIQSSETDTDCDSIQDMSLTFRLTIMILKVIILLVLPAALFDITGQFLWCPWSKDTVDSIPVMTKSFKHRLYFRIVTRGTHPLLVKQNTRQALDVLDSVLPRDRYKVEVVTDKALEVAAFLTSDCENDSTLRDEQRNDVACATAVTSSPKALKWTEENIADNFTEIIVPSGFNCSNGAKFKARALHYSILHSVASEKDWIIHLDEETRFDTDTLTYILQHCLTEDIAVNNGQKLFGNIGQGVILYGSGGLNIENYLTTLADSVRVGDDFGKFRLQYAAHAPWIGMHGSFVVCPNAVEKLIGFDHGLEGSITEDAFFALMAWSKGVKFSWINAIMFEQSPFTITDFILQRRRWFGGLWLVCCESNVIPFIYRLILLVTVSAWALSPVPILLTSLGGLVYMHDNTNGNTSSSMTCMTVLTAVTSGIFYWNYLVGFVKTFDIRDGIFRYITLLWMQIILLPMFAIMELMGVFAAILSPPAAGFYVVQKEGLNVLKRNFSTESVTGVTAEDDGETTLPVSSIGTSTTTFTPGKHVLQEEQKHSLMESSFVTSSTSSVSSGTDVDDGDGQLSTNKIDLLVEPS